MARPVLNPASTSRTRAAALGTTAAPVLHPAVAEAARRAGASRIGLVDVGCGAGFGLLVDRVGITYDDGRRAGDPSSPVQRSAAVVGDHPVPTRPVPDVVARVGLDREPVDLTDPDEASAWRAGIGPVDPGQAARLDAETALVAAARPLLLRGDPVALLPGALDLVPPDALPVVTTAWALSRFSAARRHRLVDRLQAAGRRPVAWVSVEGVGVAPGVPTLGDRPASGHSIVALAVLDGSAPRPDALGRCWSRGRWLSWFGSG